MFDRSTATPATRNEVEHKEINLACYQYEKSTRSDVKLLPVGRLIGSELVLLDCPLFILQKVIR